MTETLTILIACLVAYIAYQQYKTNRDKLKLSLFEKRFSIYEALDEFLVHILKNGNVSDEAIIDYSKNTNEAYFLFEKDIIDFMEDVIKKATKFQFIIEQLNDEEQKIGDERTKLVDDKHELAKWFGAELRSIKWRFSKYFHFGDIEDDIFDILYKRLKS